MLRFRRNAERHEAIVYTHEALSLTPVDLARESSTARMTSLSAYAHGPRTVPMRWHRLEATESARWSNHVTLPGYNRRRSPLAGQPQHAQELAWLRCSVCVSPSRVVRRFGTSSACVRRHESNHTRCPWCFEAENPPGKLTFTSVAAAAGRRVGASTERARDPGDARPRRATRWYAVHARDASALWENAARLQASSQDV